MKPNRLVVGDKSWIDVVPEWLLKEVENERMILGMFSLVNPSIDKVGDAEALVYMITASLHAPMPHEMVEIYAYLTAKILSKRGIKLQEFLKDKLDKGLTEYEKEELKKLKETIYKVRGGEINHPFLDALRTSLNTEKKKHKGGKK